MATANDHYTEFCQLVFDGVMKLPPPLCAIVADYLYPFEYLVYLIHWLKAPKYDSKRRPYWENDRGIPIVTFRSSVPPPGPMTDLLNMVAQTGRSDVAYMMTPYIDPTEAFWRADRDFVITMIVVDHIFTTHDGHRAFAFSWRYVRPELVEHFTIGTKEIDSIIPYDIEVIEENITKLQADLIQQSNDVDLSNGTMVADYILSLRRTSRLCRVPADDSD